jgi:hypothetical protein
MSNNIKINYSSDPESPKEATPTADFDTFNYKLCVNEILAHIKAYLYKHSIPDVVLNSSHVVYTFDKKTICKRTGYFITNIFNGPSDDSNYFKNNKNHFRPIQLNLNEIAVLYKGYIKVNPIDKINGTQTVVFSRKK